MERSGIVFHFFLILSRLELAAGFGPIGPLPGPLGWKLVSGAAASCFVPLKSTAPN